MRLGKASSFASLDICLVPFHPQKSRGSAARLYLLQAQCSDSAWTRIRGVGRQVQQIGAADRNYREYPSVALRCARANTLQHTVLSTAAPTAPRQTAVLHYCDTPDRPVLRRRTREQDTKLPQSILLPISPFHRLIFRQHTTTYIFYLPSGAGR